MVEITQRHSYKVNIKAAGRITAVNYSHKLHEHIVYFTRTRKIKTQKL